MEPYNVQDFEFNATEGSFIAVYQVMPDGSVVSHLGNGDNVTLSISEFLVNDQTFVQAKILTGKGRKIFTFTNGSKIVVSETSQIMPEAIDLNKIEAKVLRTFVN